MRNFLGKFFSNYISNYKCNSRTDSGVADFGLVEKDVLCAITTIIVGVDSGSSSL